MLLKGLQHPDASGHLLSVTLLILLNNFYTTTIIIYYFLFFYFVYLYASILILILYLLQDEYKKKFNRQIKNICNNIINVVKLLIPMNTFVIGIRYPFGYSKKTENLQNYIRNLIYLVGLFYFIFVF